MQIPTKIYSYIPHDFQQTIIAGFYQFEKEIEEICQQYHSTSISKPNILFLMQWTLLAIIQNLFGLNFGQVYSIFTSDRAPFIKEFLYSILNLKSLTHIYKKHIFIANGLLIINILKQFDRYYTKKKFN